MSKILKGGGAGGNLKQSNVRKIRQGGQAMNKYYDPYGYKFAGGGDWRDREKVDCQNSQCLTNRECNTGCRCMGAHPGTGAYGTCKPKGGKRRDRGMMARGGNVS